VGQGTILFVSGFVFLLTQISFLVTGKLSDPRYDVPVTFGSIILMIAGFYLPPVVEIESGRNRIGEELSRSGHQFRKHRDQQIVQPRPGDHPSHPK